MDLFFGSGTSGIEAINMGRRCIGVELKDDGINCPDYSFYLAENLITIDHQSQQATLKSFCFSQEEQVEVAKTALSIAQKRKD